MKASDVARIIKSWALENKLMSEVAPSEILSVESTEKLDELYDSLKITAENERALRTKAIAAVAFNNVINEVLIFTNKKLTAKEEKNLPIDYNEEIKIRYLHGGAASATIPTNGGVKGPYTTVNGRYTCGSSIHPARAIGAGTLGALVRAENGEIFGLSNNHVTGMSNYAQAGEKILAPGHLDIDAKSIDPFTIGHHYGALTLAFGTPDNVNVAQNSDAALIQLADVSRVSSMQGDIYDTPAVCIDLRENITVQKVGRTTGVTTGVVVGQMLGCMSVNYSIPGQGNHVAYFEDVFVVEGIGEAFSQGGDSGSLVTTVVDDERYAVGIVFAGDGVRSFILPLKPILSAFQVTLLNNHV